MTGGRVENDRWDKSKDDNSFSVIIGLDPIIQVDCYVSIRLRPGFPTRLGMTSKKHEDDRLKVTIPLSVILNEVKNLETKVLYLKVLGLLLKIIK